MRELVRKIQVIVCGALLFSLVGAGMTYGMELYVVMPTGQTVTLQAEPEDTIDDIKEFVFNVTEIHRMNQVMYYGDTMVLGKNTLEFYKVGDKDSLVVRFGSLPSRFGEKVSLIFKVFIALVVVSTVVFGARKVLRK